VAMAQIAFVLYPTVPVNSLPILLINGYLPLLLLGLIGGVVVDAIGSYRVDDAITTYSGGNGGD
jgi:hypothetical protein